MSDATRRTLRTALAVMVALAATVPVFVAELGVTASQLPWLGTVLAVSIAVTRAMQSPAVDLLLTQVGIGRQAANGRHEASEVDEL